MAGPTLALEAEVDETSTLAANLWHGLTPAGTLTAMDITSGRGDLLGVTPAGDYVFKAPHGEDTTVLTFTYIQNAIPVTGNTLTIRTGEDLQVRRTPRDEGVHGKQSGIERAGSAEDHKFGQPGHPHG